MATSWIAISLPEKLDTKPLCEVDTTAVMASRVGHGCRHWRLPGDLTLCSGPEVALQSTLLAFASCFDIDSNNVLVGTGYAVDLETASLGVLVADDLVSNSIRCAPTFECDRGGKMYRLRCCPFSFPQNYF